MKLKYFITRLSVAPFSFIDGIQQYRLDDGRVHFMLIPGGEDVHPSLYKENKGKHSVVNLNTDEFEQRLIKKVSNGTLKVGIGRGAHLLTALAGGKIIQHVNNNEHVTQIIETADGEIKMSKKHHQMMYPNDVDHVLIGWAKTNRSTVYLNGENENFELPKDFKEPEIVYYPKINALCIQGHPEWGMGSNEDVKNMRKYVNALIKNYVNFKNDI